MSQYDGAYMYQDTPKQHLKLNLWKGLATLRLICKKSITYKKADNSLTHRNVLSLEVGPSF